MFDQKLVPVHREISSIRMEVNRVDEKVTQISRRVDDIVPRRDFTKEAKRQFHCVATERYNGECPCCREVKLAEGEYQYDHFLGRELRDPEDGWIVCRKCNLKLAHDDVFKIASRARFEVFQADRRKMFGKGPANKPRKGSPTSSSPAQGNLFGGG